ncbi:MAG: DNA-3-methyladenine glycosylase I [Nitrospinota bacterium]
MINEKIRCGWVNKANKLYIDYHDKEWGLPCHDDRLHFEMLSLEGAQAGLSWEAVLKKRDAYKKLFYNFEPEKVAKMSDKQLESLLSNSAIIRNRLKVFSVRKNAIVYQQIQEEYESFDKYIWRFANNSSIQNCWKNISEIPSSTKESSAIGLDLKKRGMSFVGETIIYAYMQATGLVNDHLIDCFRYNELKA